VVRGGTEGAVLMLRAKPKPESEADPEDYEDEPVGQ